MSDELGQYYKPSGIAPGGGIVLSISAAVIASIPLGALYGLLCFYSPFVYFTVVATFMLGGFAGKAVEYGVRIGKVRSSKIAFIAGGFGALLACYSAWGAYTLATVSFEFITAILPSPVFSLMRHFVENGAPWEMFDWQPSGIPLILIWLIETGIIAVVLVGMPLAYVTETPFCEKCEAWTEREADIAQLDNTEEDMLTQALEAGEYAVLTLLPRAENLNDCLHLHADVCPECKTDCYLSIAQSVVTVNRKGETETQTTSVIAFLRVPPEVLTKARDTMVADASARSSADDDQDNTAAPLLDPERED